MEIDTVNRVPPLVLDCLLAGTNHTFSIGPKEQCAGKAFSTSSSHQLAPKCATEAEVQQLWGTLVLAHGYNRY